MKAMQFAAIVRGRLFLLTSNIVEIAHECALLDRRGWSLVSITYLDGLLVMEFDW